VVTVVFNQDTFRTEYNCIKVSETKIIIQWYHSVSGKPSWSTDTQAYIINNVNRNNATVIRGDITQW
jgi:hypothetical protein